MFNSVRNVNKFNSSVNFNQVIHRKFFDTASCLVLERAMTVTEFKDKAIGIVVVCGRPNQLVRYRNSVAGSFATAMRTLNSFPIAVPKLHKWLLSNSFVIDEKTFYNVAIFL